MYISPQIHDIEFAKDLDIVINECLPELEKLVKEGKAKYIGVTGYPLKVLKECVERTKGRLNVSIFSTYSIQLHWGPHRKKKAILNLSQHFSKLKTSLKSERSSLLFRVYTENFFGLLYNHVCYDEYLKIKYR